MNNTQTFSDRKTIWVQGFPRSGNTWLARLLGDALNSPVFSGDPRGFGANADEGFDRPGPFVIRQRHIRDQPYDGEIAYILRDPRDIAISRSLYFDLTIETLADDAKRFAMSTWQDYIGNTLKRATSAVRYEVLLRDTPRALKAMLDELSVEYDESTLSDVVERQSFDQRKQLANSVTDESRFTYGIKHEQERVLRKGIVGDWKNHFNRDMGLRAHKLFNPLMFDLGYERDLNWWRALPETVDA